MAVVTAWNIRQGGGDRAQRIVDALVAVDTDVAVLGEWRATSPNRLVERLAEVGYVHTIQQPDPLGGYAAVLVASRVPIESGANVYADESEGHRFVEFRAAGIPHVIAGALIPAHESGTDRKDRFWQYVVEEWAPSVAHEPALLCGDLNTGLHYRDELGATIRCSDQMESLYRAGWRDGWIERNRSARPPATWYSPGYDNPFRLDHAILSPAAIRVRSVEYPTRIGDDDVLGPGGLSDHLPLVVTL
jgi:exonuclease III